MLSEDKTKNVAIIPAAGSGSRFGSLKQFELLGEKPLLLLTLEVFNRTPSIDEILLAVPEPEILETKRLLKGSSLKKPIRVLAGGKDRQDSVFRGFAASPPSEIVLIHDGVRPFITVELIEEALACARKFGACVVGIPVRETMKQVGKNLFIEKTIDRNHLWSIQTPQAFRYEIFQRAIAKARTDGFVGTDEASLVERIDIPIKVLEGNPINIKITTREDMELARSLIKNWEDKNEDRNRVRHP